MLTKDIDWKESPRKRAIRAEKKEDDGIGSILLPAEAMEWFGWKPGDTVTLYIDLTGQRVMIEKAG